MTRKMFCCCAGLLLWARIPLCSQSNPLEGADSEIENAMRAFDSVGLAVSVVNDGRVVYAKGFGVRRLGGPEKVDSRTVFGIGSCTKAFTAAALAMLVDEGKLSWDDLVIDRLPSFRMSDPYATSEIRIRDLLTHRSGLGAFAGDLLCYPPTDFTEEEILARIHHIPMADGLRYRSSYSNLMYVVLGKVIQAVSGKTWSAFTEERIFTAVGMTTSSATARGLRDSANAAAPHMKRDGRNSVAEIWPQDNCGPPGAVNSSAEDMARWMIVQLQSGALPGDSGRRLFSTAAGREMHSPQVAGASSNWPDYLAPLRSDLAALGLGWRLKSYRGYKLVSHDGALPGFLASVMMIPEKRLGVVVLENSMSGVMQPVSHLLLDRMLNVQPPFDWLAGFQKLGTLSSETLQKRVAARPESGTRPSLDLAEYAGKYTDPWRGEVEIKHENGKLAIRFSRTEWLQGDLEHWHHDTFVARWRNRYLDADALVTFALGSDGRIREVRMAPVSPSTDSSFDFRDLLLTPSGAK